QLGPTTVPLPRCFHGDRQEELETAQIGLILVRPGLRSAASRRSLRCGGDPDGVTTDAVTSVSLIIEPDPDNPGCATVRVDASVDGRTYRFVLDSGAARTG